MTGDLHKDWCVSMYVPPTHFNLNDLNDLNKGPTSAMFSNMYGISVGEPAVMQQLKKKRKRCGKSGWCVPSFSFMELYI